jgi:glycine cleavage system pyridoxal-binding protein P
MLPHIKEEQTMATTNLTAARDYLATLSASQLQALGGNDGLRRALAQRGIDLDSLSKEEARQIQDYIDGRINAI